ncbi:zinc finger protein, putative [Plasmodium sp. gorilla clade G2]|uniref:zinc finger protein, putative n=1 Tax=Plasmodium sp. gorilla clade G2 TaxID=880535 RepID=UPI000D228F0A|nr:zinc finger protein, putative [Plasmodium sp. gorilla clade G2]SOV13698.1 zinc finger protein, putative [Plasmodium sp. gorilla clade G2]
MSSEKNATTPTPILCENNCGFYGNPANNNLCSKCYREFQEKKKKQISEEEKMNDKNMNDTLNNYNNKINEIMEPTFLNEKQTEKEKNSHIKEENSSIINNEQNKESEIKPVTLYNTEEKDNSSQPVEDKSKCFFCSKRIGLVGIKCRCNHYFCSLHRYADAHNCTFDYKNYHKQQLIKNNVKVVADKVEKI